jgi:hypothetical protein
MKEKSESITREEFLEIFESTTLAQLRAIRLLRRPSSTRPPKVDEEQSNMAVVLAVLAAADGPLHIDEIIARARQQHGRKLSRESLVSAITKKVLDQNTFRRTDPNTFDLLKRPSKP